METAATYKSGVIASDHAIRYSRRFAATSARRQATCRASTAPAASGQNFLHHVAVHIGQPEVAALEPEREPFVVDPQQVQHGRLEVVHVHRLVGNVVAEIVGGPVAEARPDPAAGHPDRETVWVMV